MHLNNLLPTVKFPSERSGFSKELFSGGGGEDVDDDHHIILLSFSPTTQQRFQPKPNNVCPYFVDNAYANVFSLLVEG